MCSMMASDQAVPKKEGDVLAVERLDSKASSQRMAHTSI